MPWAKTDRWWFWDYLFARFRWYRRLCGGHWEWWYNDATWSHMWFQMDRCSRADDYRPPCCFGRPHCED
jgi:hypothetical protein